MRTQPQAHRHEAVQPGPVPAGIGGAGHGGRHQPGALSRGQPLRGQVPAAEAAVFLRLRHHAVHHPQAHRGVRHPEELPREERHPDQRHPPHAGDPGADAYSHRRRGPWLGRGVGYHHPLRGLHQPYGAGRGAGGMAAAAVRDAAAPCLADPAGDRPPLAEAGGGILPRPRQDRQAGHHLGRPCAHGQPVPCRVHGCQRRVGAALRDPA